MDRRCEAGGPAGEHRHAEVSTKLRGTIPLPHAPRASDDAGMCSRAGVALAGRFRGTASFDRHGRAGARPPQRMERCAEASDGLAADPRGGRAPARPSAIPMTRPNSSVTSHKPTKNPVRFYSYRVYIWYSRGESNPCSLAENQLSWATRRREPVLIRTGWGSCGVIALVNVLSPGPCCPKRCRPRRGGPGRGRAWAAGRGWSRVRRRSRTAHRRWSAGRSAPRRGCAR